MVEMRLMFPHNVDVSEDDDVSVAQVNNFVSNWIHIH